MELIYLKVCATEILTKDRLHSCANLNDLIARGQASLVAKASDKANPLFFQARALVAEIEK